MKEVLKVYTGPMASGKTDEFISYLKIAKVYMKKVVLVARPETDKRSKMISSRTGAMLEPDFVFKDYSELIEFLEDNKGKNVVFGIDEIQLNPDAFNKKASRELARAIYEISENSDVIVTLLNKTFAGEPFGYISGYLLSIADDIIVKKAVCGKCGIYGATLSMRLKNNKPVPYNAPIIDPGYHYISVDRKCHEVPGKPWPNEINKVEKRDSNGFLIAITGPPNSGKSNELESFIKGLSEGTNIAYFPAPASIDSYIEKVNKGAEVILIDNFDPVKDGEKQAVFLDALAYWGYGVVVAGINNKGGEPTAMIHILPRADDIILKKKYTFDGSLREVTRTAESNGIYRPL